MKMSLYEITEELAKLDEIFELNGGALPEGEQGETLQAWLDKYEFMAREKVDGYGAYWANLKAAVEAYEEEAGRLMMKAKAAAHKIENLKTLAEVAMVKLKRDRLEGQIFTIAKQPNGGVIPMNIREPYKSEPEKLPEAFQKITVSVDNKKIREELEKNPAGEVATFAYFLPRGSQIRLK